jgi:hyperosmotically inducible protein
MIRLFSAALLAVVLVPAATFAQDRPLQRAGRALDNAGRNIRNRVETEVVRGQINAQEREVLHRVSRRIEWDKPLVSSTIQLEAQPGGLIVVRGSVLDLNAKRRAIDLVENTIGVTTVVDELAVVKDVKVIEAAPAPRVIEVTPPVTVVPETRVIIKP